MFEYKEDESTSKFLDVLYPNQEYRRPGKYHPNINISELDDEYVLEVFAPGMRKTDFSIDINNSNVLIISAEKPTSEAIEQAYIIQEMNFNNFSRSIKLSEDINTENIDAKYKNGVLTITLKKEELKNYKIEIK